MVYVFHELIHPNCTGTDYSLVCHSCYPAALQDNLIPRGNLTGTHLQALADDRSLFIKREHIIRLLLIDRVENSTHLKVLHSPVQLRYKQWMGRRAFS